MIGVFPTEEQDAVQKQLSRVLRAVVSQRLLKRIEGTGRVPAVEIMFVTQAISNLVRKGELEQIYSLMQTGNSEGMLLLEQSLASLFAYGLVNEAEALSLVRDTSIFQARVLQIQESCKFKKRVETCSRCRWDLVRDRCFVIPRQSGCNQVTGGANAVRLHRSKRR